MRDPREQMAAYGEAFLAVEPVLGDRAMAAQVAEYAAERGYELDPSQRALVEQFYGRDVARGTRRDLPKPPPAELGFDPEKWQRMTRVERRAVIRHARKVQK